MNGFNPMQMMQMIKNLKGGNPQQILDNMLRQNPNFSMFIQQMQNSADGRTPKEMVMQIAKQHGISEAEVMRMHDMLPK